MLLWLPNEKERVACLRIPGGGGFAASWMGFRRIAFRSSWPCVRSVADDGAVETLLCRDDASVELVLVVFDEPLPLRHRSVFMP